MSIPNNLGHKYDSSLPVININTGNANTSTSGQITSTILNSVFGVGMLALTGAMKGGSSAGTQETQQTQQAQQVQRAPEQTPEQIIQSQRDQVKVMENYINALNETIEDLTAKTDETKIQTLRDSVATQKEELFGAKSQYKDLANQIQEKDMACSSAEAKYTEVTTSLNKANSDLAALKTKKENAAALKDDPKAQARAKELDGLIKQKEEEIAALTQKQTEAKDVKSKANSEREDLKKKDSEKFTEVQLKLQTYNEAKKNLTEMENAKETNSAMLKKAINDKAKAETQLNIKKEQIQNAENDLIDRKGAAVNKDKADAGNYQKGVKGNGNWWKRNMPTWLGGSNKAKTAEYKDQNEKKNDAIESYMNAHNCTRSQAKKALKQLAQLNNNSTSGTKVKQTSEQKDTKSAVQQETKDKPNSEQKAIKPSGQQKMNDPRWLNPKNLPSDKPKNIWEQNEPPLWYSS